MNRSAIDPVTGVEYRVLRKGGLTTAEFTIENTLASAAPLFDQAAIFLSDPENRGLTIIAHSFDYDFDSNAQRLLLVLE